MMKRILLAIATVMVFSSANAQDVRYGVKTGLNVSYFISDTKSEIASPKYGFHIGGVAEIKMNEKFSIQPEILYSTQGLRFDGFTPINHKKILKVYNDDAQAQLPIVMGGLKKINEAIKAKTAAGEDVTELKAKQANLLIGKQKAETIIGLYNSKKVGVEGNGGWDYTYINIPVLAKYYVTNELTLGFGPQLGLLLGAKKHSDVELYAEDDKITLPSDLHLVVKKYIVLGKHDEDIKDKLKTLDLGLVFSASYDFHRNFNVGARYNFGLTDFKKRKEGDKGYSKNANVQLSFTYFF